METNYLAHHGIKGQRWGVRRYQNPDGSLTNAGKMRYRLEADTSNRAPWQYSAEPIDLNVKPYKSKKREPIKSAEERYKEMNRRVQREVDRFTSDITDKDEKEYVQWESKTIRLLNELEKETDGRFSYNGSEYFDNPEQIQKTIKAIYKMQELEAKGRFNRKL